MRLRRRPSVAIFTMDLAPRWWRRLQVRLRVGKARWMRGPWRAEQERTAPTTGGCSTSTLGTAPGPTACAAVGGWPLKSPWA